MDPNVIKLAMGAGGAGATGFNLYAWGSNLWGYIGDGTSTNKIDPNKLGSLTNWSKVSAGGTFSISVKTDGTLWAWGSGTSGELGDGTTVAKSSPIQVGALSN